MYNIIIAQMSYQIEEECTTRFNNQESRNIYNIWTTFSMESDAIGILKLKSHYHHSFLLQFQIELQKEPD